MGAPFGEIGPCGVNYDSTDLGENQNVIVRHVEETADHRTAQYGSSPKDQIYTGNTAEVEVVLTESSLAQLNKLTPSGTVTANQLMIGNSVGTSLRASAAKLILKPYINGTQTTDETKWITFFIAAPVIDWEIPFNVDGDRGYRTTFRCFRVTETVSGETYQVGDLFAIGYGQTS